MSAGDNCCTCVSIEVDEEQADDATSRLFDLGSGGVEWRDATTLPAASSGKVKLIASFERAAVAQAAAAELPRAWSPRLHQVDRDAWLDEWKKYFEPFRIAPTIVVTPPWRRANAEAGDTVLVLEPGRAFGTGLHETTSLVAEFLADRAARFRGQPVLDVGCGSGILSLVALALGASRARALDVDPEAIQVARENAARNGAGESIEADNTPLDDVTGAYATVVANIEARTLVGLAPALANRVASGGLLVLSGILAADAAPGQLDAVRRAYTTLREEEVRCKGDWVAVVLSR
jgi:ribosomal protein L11 methyltransferase